MKILYLYRHPAMGFSIGKVFQPIEKMMSDTNEVDSFSMPCIGYSPLSLIRNVWATWQVIRKKKYDIIHITGQEHYLIPFLCRKKLVVTVHDLQSIISTEKGLSGRIKHFFFIKTLPWAQYLTCISEKSKSELMDVCGIEANKISVIHNSFDEAYYAYRPKMEEEHKPIILHIGVTPNKNLFRVMKALEGLHCHLRIIGNPPKDILEPIFLDYSIVSGLSDETMFQEYCNCDVVSFPSLYEGFGMPIIEGQAIGRVVVTSHISPMKEVAGDGAIFVDPYDVDSIRRGFIEAIEKPQSYIDKGLENIKRFSLKEISCKYLDLYKEVCSTLR